MAACLRVACRPAELTSSTPSMPQSVLPQHRCTTLLQPFPAKVIPAPRPVAFIARDHDSTGAVTTTGHHKPTIDVQTIVVSPPCHFNIYLGSLGNKRKGQTRNYWVNHLPLRLFLPSASILHLCDGRYQMDISSLEHTVACGEVTSRHSGLSLCLDRHVARRLHGRVLCSKGSAHQTLIPCNPQIKNLAGGVRIEECNLAISLEYPAVQPIALQCDQVYVSRASDNLATGGVVFSTTSTACPLLLDRP
jgi:hypothetical protein